MAAYRSSVRIAWCGLLALTLSALPWLTADPSRSDEAPGAIATASPDRLGDSGDAELSRLFRRFTAVVYVADSRRPTKAKTPVPLGLRN